MRSPRTIIVSHETADFDGFAAAVAAQLLEPEAVIVLPRSLGGDLRDFLALHKDRFPSVAAGELDLATIDRVVIVDVRRASRIAGLDPLLARICARDPGLEVVIWDHHAAADDDLPATELHVDAVGSVTTLLVEAIRARGLAIDPVHATLMAIGVHADTGSLTYAGTTARDARALACLLGQGARLAVVSRYLRPPFTDAQRAALVALLGGLEIERIGGLEIGLAGIELEEGTPGLDVVTSEALALGRCAAIFAAFGIRGRKSLVVARARPGTLDVRPPLAGLGGGGHSGAASAAIGGEAPASVIAAIRAALHRSPPAPPQVAAIMRSPALALDHRMSLRSADERLATAGLRGAAVLREGALRGMITRHDLDRAARDDRLDLPIASCMSHHVESVAPEASLEEALERMTARDIGHLPVLRGDRLIGMVTRDQLLAALYGDRREGS